MSNNAMDCLFQGLFTFWTVQVVRRKAVGSQALLAHHHEALWMAYKPLTKPDKDLLDRCF